MQITSRIFSVVAGVVLLTTLTATAAEPPITSIAFTPDGKSVVACSQSGLQQFSWPDLLQQKKIEVQAHNAHEVRFSPAGDRLAIGGGTPGDEGTVEILSWPAAQRLHVLVGHSDSVMSLRWLSAATLASAGLDHDVVLWNTKTGARVKRLKGHSRGVTCLSTLSDQATLVSAGIDNSLRVWKSDSGDLIHSLNIHTKPVHALASRPSDRPLPMVASASEDRTVRFRSRQSHPSCERPETTALVFIRVQ